MNFRKAIVFFCFSMFIFSCRNKTGINLFEEFVNKKSVDNFLVLQTANVTPLKSLDKDYRTIILNNENASFLLEKAKSTQITEYCIPNLVSNMTEGDIAICMLLDMFNMTDEYFESVMYENIERTTNTAYDFWKYIHISEINRDEIIKKIIDWISIYTSSDLIIPWTEEEILNHSFELISDTEVEKITFTLTNEGLPISSCIYGKKDAFVTAPIEYWKILDGCLIIYPYETVLTKKQIKIEKITIDEKNKILYAYRNYKKVVYKYKEL